MICSLALILSGDGHTSLLLLLTVDGNKRAPQERLVCVRVLVCVCVCVGFLNDTMPGSVSRKLVSCVTWRVWKKVALENWELLTPGWDGSRAVSTASGTALARRKLYLEAEGWEPMGTLSVPGCLSEQL